MKQCILVAAAFISFISSIVMSFTDQKFYFAGAILFVLMIMVVAFGRKLRLV